jgi:hypothetical protein
MQEYKYYSVANQRTILITREPCNQNKLYTSITIDALSKAAGQIKTIGGLKLYLYLVSNQHGYKFALSSSDFCEWANICQNTYLKGFNELVSRGYLIPVTKDLEQQEDGQEEKQDHVACYVFSDKPKTEQEAETAKQEIETTQHEPQEQEETSGVIDLPKDPQRRRFLLEHPNLYYDKEHDRILPRSS